MFFASGSLLGFKFMLLLFISIYILQHESVSVYGKMCRVLQIKIPSGYPFEESYVKWR